MEIIAVSLGLIGVVIVLIAYGLLTTGRIGENDARYYWLNIIGTTGIAVSILVQWNLASMVAQILWIIVSFFGLYRIRKARA